jgi:hypothetical protein
MIILSASTLFYCKLKQIVKNNKNNLIDFYLNASVGKVDPVRSGHVTADILALGLLEVGPGQIVLNAVLVSVRFKGRGRWAVGLGSGQSQGEERAENDELKE